MVQRTAGKRMPSIVYSSLDRHIVHPFWIAMLAPSCGAAQVVRGGVRSLRPTHLTLWRIFTRRCGACLALLALTLQFGMSYGHIHARDFTGRGIHRSTADVARAWRGPMKQQSAARLPAKLADDDEDCPICFSGFLLATSFIPDAAQASRSLDLTDAGHPFALTFDGVLKTHRAPFQSRAPPLG